MAERDHEPTKPLAALVGTWRTTGSTKSRDDAPSLEIDAVDTYEWLPGEWAVLHRVDARVGSEHVEGAEIIGWDPEHAGYRTMYFGSDGPNSYDATLEDEAGTLVWRMQSRSDRFTGAFSADQSRIEGHWEQLDESGTWVPWMDVTLRKETGPRGAERPVGDVS